MFPGGAECLAAAAAAAVCFLPLQVQVSNLLPPGGEQVEQPETPKFRAESQIPYWLPLQAVLCIQLCIDPLAKLKHTFRHAWRR